MRFGIKKSKGYVYGFNVDEEVSIYNKIGAKISPYQNYCEWHSYVYEKYGRNKYTESTLKNNYEQKGNLEWVYNSTISGFYDDNIHICVFGCQCYQYL